jgi:Domain of unknown function (DUF4293)
MLQRIQSIWLFLAAVCAFLSFKFSYYAGTISEKDIVNGFKEINGTSNIAIIITTTALAVLALISIFLYRNRKLQLRLCMVGILLEAGLIFLYYSEVKKFNAGNYSIAALLQGCIALFFLLAARGISNDEKIIKESNRLR